MHLATLQCTTSSVCTSLYSRMFHCKMKQFRITSGLNVLHALLSVFRFSQLKSLNLSHNRLGSFPECVCEILTLTELNISCNNLHSVPAQIGNLQRYGTVQTEGCEKEQLILKTTHTREGDNNKCVSNKTRNQVNKIINQIIDN